MLTHFSQGTIDITCTNIGINSTLQKYKMTRAYYSRTVCNYLGQDDCCITDLYIWVNMGKNNRGTLCTVVQVLTALSRSFLYYGVWGIGDVDRIHRIIHRGILSGVIGLVAFKLKAFLRYSIVYLYTQCLRVTIANRSDINHSVKWEIREHKR